VSSFQAFSGAGRISATISAFFNFGVLGTPLPVGTSIPPSSFPIKTGDIRSLIFPSNKPPSAALKTSGFVRVFAAVIQNIQELSDPTQSGEFDPRKTSGANIAVTPRKPTSWPREEQEVGADPQN